LHDAEHSTFFVAENCHSEFTKNLQFESVKRLREDTARNKKILHCVQNDKLANEMDGK